MTAAGRRGGGTPRAGAMPVPPQPDGLRRGLCATGLWPPDLWHADRPAGREKAQAICRRCPALQACADWALSLRPCDDTISVLGGLTAGQRSDLRSKRAQAGH